MKLSEHGKARMRQRTQLNHKGRRLLVKEALAKGLMPEQVKDDGLRNFLLSKVRYNSRVKLYKDYVFIYSRNSHRLYTMYEVPEEYKGRK